MLLDDMQDYLSSGGVSSGIMFGGVLPPGPNTAIGIYETGGLASVHTMGHAAGQAAVERPSIQVVSRAEDYETARVNAHLAYMLLDGLPKRTINGVQYYWGAAVQSPFLMGRDADDRVRVAFNVDLIKDLSTTS